jgi:cytochrome c-type biogenesis protein CcmI
MAIVIAVVLVVALAIFVAAPLLLGSGEAQPGEDPDRADLEARKESLYRQIRDAELDREQGKLSHDDWERVDAELRRDAIAVLKRLDSLD